MLSRILGLIEIFQLKKSLVKKRGVDHESYGKYDEIYRSKGNK